MLPSRQKLTSPQHVALRSLRPAGGPAYVAAGTVQADASSVAKSWPIPRLLARSLRSSSGSRELRCSALGLVRIATFVLVAAVGPGGKASSQELERGEASDYHGFSFVPGSCEQGREFCSATTPRAWAPTEIDTVRAALDAIETKDLGRRIMRRALRNGFKVMRRFAYAAQPNERGVYDIEPSIAATAHRDDRHSLRTIDLTDQFFERKSARDHFSGDHSYFLTTEVLLHELLHAIDFDQRYSSSSKFRNIAWLWLTEFNLREAKRVNEERVRLNREGRYEESWQASRFFGVATMIGRLPSVQALDSYREAFAEFGAHLVLDPSARQRFDPRVVRYFDNVLSDLRYADR